MTKIKTGAKTKHPAKESLKAKNLAKATKEIRDHKVNPKPDTKYEYPKGCLTLGERKEFRRKSRSSISRFEKTIAKLKKSNKADDRKLIIKIEREYKAFKGAILQ
jgi:hypothetical protein